ncbi:MAG: hypothetical protein CMJ42_11400 [Phyllobacteriaceae bacterium]|nr:hypothetical protein [Phyllobacteriaceae bacterium]MBA89307.1 hypothetical protein [Phyllobacteriaceae bacterium]
MLRLSLVILGLVPGICRGARAGCVSVCDGCRQRIRTLVCETRVQILATRARMTRFRMLRLSLVILGLVPGICCGGKTRRVSICDGFKQRIRTSVGDKRVQILATRARMTRFHMLRLSLVILGLVSRICCGGRGGAYRSATAAAGRALI